MREVIIFLCKFAKFLLLSKLLFALYLSDLILFPWKENFQLKLICCFLLGCWYYVDSKVIVHLLSFSEFLIY